MGIFSFFSKEYEEDEEELMQEVEAPARRTSVQPESAPSG